LAGIWYTSLNTVKPAGFLVSCIQLYTCLFL